MSILCKNCNNLKFENDFTPSQLKNNFPKCKDCVKESNRLWKAANKEHTKEYGKKWREDNEEERKEYNKKWKADNVENIKEYNKQWNKDNEEWTKEYRRQRYIENREEDIKYTRQYNAEHKKEKKEYKKQYNKNKYKTDADFKLRKNISGSVNRGLRSNGSSKNGSSILNYLPYSIEELKNYLELLFEPWMTWENWAVYNPETWKDGDQSTWVWNLDHINPQTDFVFISMEDASFKKCWALDNLRPYDAKKNSEEAHRRTPEEIAKIKEDIRIFLESKKGHKNI